jgi:hypothetical protein
MARHIEDLEIEAEVREGNDIATLDRVIDRRNALPSRTENRDLPLPEKLIHAANMVAVVVGEEDGSELQLPFLENLDDE